MPAGRSSTKFSLPYPWTCCSFMGMRAPPSARPCSGPISRRCGSSPAMIWRQVAAYGQASGVLLDTYVPGIPGGTGEAFDWSLVPQGLNKPIILAGGLVAENVAAAIRQVRPYAVDVSGGVEAGKGIKDAEKIRAFMRAVKTAGG